MDPSDFFVRELFDLAQQERVAPRRGELVERCTHAVFERAPEDLALQIAAQLVRRLVVGKAAVDDLEAPAQPSIGVQVHRALHPQEPPAKLGGVP